MAKQLTIDDVRKATEEAITAGEYSIAKIAASLNMSERTFCQHEGTHRHYSQSFHFRHPDEAVCPASPGISRQAIAGNSPDVRFRGGKRTVACLQACLRPLSHCIP